MFLIFAIIALLTGASWKWVVGWIILYLIFEATGGGKK